MRILLVSPFPPTKGGISTYSRRTVTALEALGEKVLVCNFSRISDYFPNFKTAKAFSPDVIRLEYNIATYGIHSPFIFAGLLLYRIYRKDVMIVANFHEVKRDTDMLGFLGRIWYTLIPRIFDNVYVHTEEAKTILTKKCFISDNLVSVIPLGTYYFSDMNYYEDELINQFDLENKKLILSFGYIHIHKGLDYLIEACKLLKDDHPEIWRDSKVIIAGAIRKRKGIFKGFEKRDIRYFKKLKARINELDMADQIVFTGYTEEKMVYSLFRRAHVVVLPYTNTEQSGVLNQAIAAGTPVIASAIGGLEETLRDVGILVQPKDSKCLANALAKCLRDDTYYLQLEQNYIALNEKLSPKNVMSMFINNVTKAKAK